MEPRFDEAWRRAALAGERGAVDTLAAACLAPLYRFCLYRVGGDRHLCEEAVQETLLRAIRDLDKYEPRRAEGNVFPWLAGLARNEIHRVLARQKATASLDALWARLDDELRAVYARLEREPLDDAVLRREETREMVNATMAQLPDHYRAALEAKYVAGQSVREMADAWQLTEKAVESRLTRARAAFRATFLALSRGPAVEMM